MNIDQEIFSPKTALSDEQLKEWCRKNHLPFHLLTLTELNEATQLPSQFFIFTGDNKDQINEGHDHHWLFGDGNLVFDSYGGGDSGGKGYKLPEHFEIIKNIPKRLQNYNSKVCGEYCCAFYKFAHDNPDIELEDIGEEFSNHMGFTTDRLLNDEEVLKFYKETSK